MSEPITIFQCPPKCEHKWDGPELIITAECSHCNGAGSENGVECKRCNGKGEYECGASSTCSKCGMSAMDHSLWSD